MNLSDYEEKGDSEDEQMKARKKRKYEPKPNQDSDGEESSMSTRAGPYSARNVFINPTEGFKYSDLYMVCILLVNVLLEYILYIGCSC